MKPAVVVLLVVSMVALASREANACVCVRLPDSCARIAEADAVFEATVSWTETRRANNVSHPGFLSTERVVHLRDVRTWRGEPADAIVTGMGGGDCGFEFEAGTRYMIEAYRKPSGELWTGICSKTQPLASARGFREYVESLSAPSRGGHIWGRVLTPRFSAETWMGGSPESDPLEGATVTITGPVQRAATVGGDGVFSISALPPGEYTISVIPPVARRDLEAIPPRTVTLDGARACRDLRIDVAFSNRIEGRVVDDAGEPVANAMIDLLLAPRQPRSLSQVCAFTDEDGRYSLTNLPPGRYLAGVSVATGPSSLSPFAPASGRGRHGASEVVIPDRGAAIELQPIIARRVMARAVDGVVTWADGRPGSGLRVGGAIVDASGPIPALIPSTTAADGTFTLALHDGLHYRLVVREGRTVVHEVDVVAGEGPIAIRLPSP